MLLSLIYLIAISAEAMTGALSAGRRRMDLFGVVIIACVTALGGGSLRDIVLGHYQLGWVKHPEYLGFTICAALIATWVARWMHHFRRTFLVLDGLGLIAFTLIGCAVARPVSRWIARRASTLRIATRRRRARSSAWGWEAPPSVTMTTPPRRPSRAAC